MRAKALSFAIVLIVIAWYLPAAADEYARRSEMEQLRAELQELKTLVQDMKQVIGQQQETIQRLRAQPGAAVVPTDTASGAGAHPERTHVAAAGDGDPLSLDGLLARVRPRIGLTGDFLVNFSEDHHSRITEDRFDLRGVDLVFSGEIDGLGSAFFNFAYHEDDVVLEEAWLIAQDLLPGRIDVKLGKFRVDFGLLNTVHPHALPQVDYPVMYREYLGHEGYIDEGVGIAGSLPSLWGTPVEYSLQALNGHRHTHGHEDDLYDAAEDTDGRLRDYDDIVCVARLRNRLDLSPRLDLSLGLSGLSGRFEDDQDSPRFYYQGGDLRIDWRPFQESWRRVRLQAEYIGAQVEEGRSWERSWGMYGFADVRFAPRWIAGARYDSVERPRRSRDHLTGYTLYLTHDYRPDSRLRLQFTSAHENHGKDANEVLLQWIFSLGHHPHQHGQ